jgi:hypothetical protein
MSERPYVDCKSCGQRIPSLRMDRAELDEALDKDLREVCPVCGAIRQYVRSDYYFPDASPSV